METSIRLAEAKLRAYKQEHVLKMLKDLPKPAQQKLIKQIDRIDFERLFKALDEHNQSKKPDIASVTPIPYEDWDCYEEQEKHAFTEIGWELLRKGKIGAIVVAGGQGSRLGHEGPKGTLDICLPSGKSLFQLQAERLLNLSGSAGRLIPWYIMTSPDNHDATVSFFQKHQYFGYSALDCFFFQQNTLPALDLEGKLLLTADGAIKEVPSGHGECFASLKRSGAIADMKQRGLSWLFYYNVDNALIKVADPAFIGVAASHNHPIATKVIEKSDAGEKIGIVCLNHGRPAVLEYNEIPDHINEARTNDGRLFYSLGHISIHLFKLAFIEEYADADVPLHIASKKLDYLGNKVMRDVPNAYKLERFIFDFFPYADQLTVLRASREDEFAPVKNKAGDDSPHSARQLVLAQHMRWLHAAGIRLDMLKQREIEISPLLSYSGEGLNIEVLNNPSSNI
ncbi:UTP--glucose-1-phosphate uridylyltransferase [Paenibacillus sp. PL91]|uniref:UTP--glucose-1-phosphate uridylyltransferase n=1 Tax=Paenibacillus sp. PL91 TaxID=2729538 RepID=UPI00145EEC4D|nr:UDPGP type 1 family protein [Paenibacillus sp. PL91]MBC9202054.1 UDPGP type 1 family protein [Paenibacillus sp. PL91]